MAVSRLSKIDWIRAAFRALKSGGPPAVKAEPLARSLGVSKGSFYHHFRDLNDLHAKMLAHWEQEGTREVATQIESAEMPPRGKLEALFKTAISDGSDPYGGPLTETAIRSWAAQSEMVAVVQTRVDEARTAFVTGLFEADGADDPAHWAALFYASFVGSAHMKKGDRTALAHLFFQLYDQRDR